MRSSHPYVLLLDQTASIIGYILGVRMGQATGVARPFDPEGDLQPIVDRVRKIEEIIERDIKPLP